jgi:hypothetical protein
MKNRGGQGGRKECEPLRAGGRYEGRKAKKKVKTDSKGNQAQCDRTELVLGAWRQQGTREVCLRAGGDREATSNKQ